MGMLWPGAAGIPILCCVIWTFNIICDKIKWLYMSVGGCFSGTVRYC